MASRCDKCKKQLTYGVNGKDCYIYFNCYCMDCIKPECYNCKANLRNSKIGKDFFFIHQIYCKFCINPHKYLDKNVNQEIVEKEKVSKIKSDDDLSFYSKRKSREKFSDTMTLPLIEAQDQHPRVLQMTGGSESVKVKVNQRSKSHPIRPELYQMNSNKQFSGSNRSNRSNRTNRVELYYTTSYKSLESFQKDIKSIKSQN